MVFDRNVSRHVFVVPYSWILEGCSRFWVTAVLNSRLVCIHSGLAPDPTIESLTKSSDEFLFRPVTKGLLKPKMSAWLCGHRDVALPGLVVFGDECICLTIFGNANYSGGMNDASICVIGRVNKDEIHVLCPVVVSESVHFVWLAAIRFHNLIITKSWDTIAEWGLKRLNGEIRLSKWTYLRTKYYAQSIRHNKKQHASIIPSDFGQRNNWINHGALGMRNQTRWNAWDQLKWTQVIWEVRTWTIEDILAGGLAFVQSFNDSSAFVLWQFIHLINSFVNIES
jgi:hypothetical protein